MNYPNYKQREENHREEKNREKDTGSKHSELSQGARLRSILSALLVSLYSFPVESSSAQVNYSASVQQIYDSNIFLEEGELRAPVRVTDPATGIDQLIELPDEFNGKEDNDLITNLSLSAFTDEQFSPYIDSIAGGTVGFVLFADYTDQSRITLDTDVSLLSSQQVLPDPIFVGARSNFTAGSANSVSSAGAATQFGQYHTGQLVLGTREAEILERTAASSSYTFSRADFLGTFRFNDDNSDPATEELLNLNPEVQGSDYFLHTLNGTIKRQVSSQVEMGLQGVANEYIYTDVPVALDGLTDQEREDQANQTQGSARVFSNYKPRSNLNFFGSTGVDFARFREERLPTTITSVDREGNISEEVITPDRESTNFAFTGSVTYTPDLLTQLSVGVDKSTGVDYDGSRLEGFSIFGSASREIITDLSLSASGRYLQFDSDSFQRDDIERIEATLAANYALTTSLVLGVGYNYVTQDTSSDLLQLGASSFGAQATDYDVHRAFVSISGYFDGLKR